MSNFYNKKMDSSAKISNDQRLRRNHLELVNTIKRENVELKEQINQIYLMLQQSVLSNHLNKQNTFLENDEIEVDEKINLDKLKELEKKIKLESNQQKNIEKKN